MAGAQIGLMGRTSWRPLMEELRLTKLELHNQSYKGKRDESKLLNALTEALPPWIQTQALNIFWLVVCSHRSWCTEVSLVCLCRGGHEGSL